MISVPFTLPPGTWLLGVSGGGDSLALAHLAQQAEHAMPWAHFNHRWSAWGDDAEAFVREQAAQLGATVHVGHGRGRAPSNAEAVARTERHDFFKALCTQHGYAGVVLAHTQDDVAETFLMRAGKGSGVRGLAAMAPMADVAGLKVLRPLLGVGRNELRDYLRSVGQTWRDDPDETNQRARVRALLPALAAAGIPVHGLAAAAQAAGRAQAAVAAQVAAHVPHTAELKIETLGTLPTEVGLQLLGEILARFAPGLVVRTTKRQNLLAAVLERPEGVATLGGLRWEWREGVLRWQAQPQ